MRAIQTIVGTTPEAECIRVKIFDIVEQIGTQSLASYGFEILQGSTTCMVGSCHQHAHLIRLITRALEKLHGPDISTNFIMIMNYKEFWECGK